MEYFVKVIIYSPILIRNIFIKKFFMIILYGCNGTDDELYHNINIKQIINNNQLYLRRVEHVTNKTDKIVALLY